ncbi:hypothetical protein HK104_002347, partial [Borealophlyctis nickersoniae]
MLSVDRYLAKNSSTVERCREEGAEMGKQLEEIMQQLREYPDQIAETVAGCSAFLKSRPDLGSSSLISYLEDVHVRTAEKIKELQESGTALMDAIPMIFDVPELKKEAPLSLHAVFVDEYGTHYAFVKVRDDKDPAKYTWFKFGNNQVSQVTETDALAGQGVTSVWYAKEEVARGPDGVDLEALISKGLKAAVQKDNETHMREVEEFQARSSNPADLSATNASSSSPSKDTATHVEPETIPMPTAEEDPGVTEIDGSWIHTPEDSSGESTLGEDSCGMEVD